MRSFNTAARSGCAGCATGGGAFCAKVAATVKGPTTATGGLGAFSG